MTQSARILKPWLSAIVVLLLFSCNDDKGVAPDDLPLVSTLNEELAPLSADPILWTDAELTFLDEAATSKVVGLGEATHGTAEFFKAKHRILRYLVEVHGFRIFAIEADMGESLFINEAVMSGDKSKIDLLMKTKMHFWTWKTKEVQEMLFWMCEYNAGKAESDKVQYWGVDCQFLTYQRAFVLSHLMDANVSFLAWAEQQFDKIKSASANQFSGYTQPAFDGYLASVDALRDTLAAHQAEIVAATTQQRFAYTMKLIEVVRQTSEVMFYRSRNPSRFYRDEYMAKNTGWLLNQFNNSKVVLWAHNWHVAIHSDFGSQGFHLKNMFKGDYTTIGFLFSKGEFRAMTKQGSQFMGLAKQSLEADPKPGSINEVMGQASTSVFSVSTSDLLRHPAWQGAFTSGIQYFQIGAVYNGRPLDHYVPINTANFDRFIYFDRTTSALSLD